MTFIEELISLIKAEIQDGNFELPLEKLRFGLRGTEIEDQIIQIFSIYKVLKQDYRSGVISYDSLNIGRSKVINSILEILKIIEERTDLHRNIRLNEKSLWFGAKVTIHVDFSAILDSEKFPHPNPYTTYFTTKFLDANDFLNELFFKIKEFVLPGTYGRKWMLVQDTGSLRFYPPIPVTIKDIEKILKQVPDEWHIESLPPVNFNSHIVHPYYKVHLIKDEKEFEDRMSEAKAGERQFLEGLKEFSESLKTSKLEAIKIPENIKEYFKIENGDAMISDLKKILTDIEKANSAEE